MDLEGLHQIRVIHNSKGAGRLYHYSKLSLYETNMSLLKEAMPLHGPHSHRVHRMGGDHDMLYYQLFG